jgi:uncharacterized protein
MMLYLFLEKMKRMAPVPPVKMGTNAFTYTVGVDNFDEVVTKIIENGGKVTMPRFAVTGRCWQGYFIDHDNNVFGLSQPGPDAKCVL